MNPTKCNTKSDCAENSSCQAFCTNNGVPDLNVPCKASGQCQSNDCSSFCVPNNCGIYICTDSEICATNLLDTTKTVCITQNCNSDKECSSTQTSYICENNTCTDMSCDPTTISNPNNNIILSDKYLCVKNQTINGLLIPQPCETDDDCRNDLTGYTCYNSLCKNMNSASICIADEPTSAYDEGSEDSKQIAACSASQYCCSFPSDPKLCPYACCDNKTECCTGVNGNMCCVGNSSCVYDSTYENGVCCGANQIAQCSNGGESPCTCVDCPSGQTPSSVSCNGSVPVSTCYDEGKIAMCAEKGYLGYGCCTDSQTLVCDSTGSCNCN